MQCLDGPIKHLDNPISSNDNRYTPAKSQEFRTFEEGDQLIRDYCRKCIGFKYSDAERKHDCDSLHNLRLGMAEDCPYWDGDFVKLEKKDNFDLDGDNLPDELIVCKKFKSKQSRFDFDK